MKFNLNLAVFDFETDNLNLGLLEFFCNLGFWVLVIILLGSLYCK